MSFNELKLWRATKGAWWWEQKARTKLNKVQTRMTRCIRGKMQETGVVTVAPGVSALHGIPHLSHPVISCHSSCCTITQNISPCTAGLNIPTSYKPSESADILYISVKVSFYSLCHNPGLNLTSASSQPFFILFIILFKGMNKKKKRKKEKRSKKFKYTSVGGQKAISQSQALACFSSFSLNVAFRDLKHNIFHSRV